MALQKAFAGDRIRLSFKRNDSSSE